MSRWRKIWRMAIRANQMLVLNRPEGEAEFRRLFEGYPDDGMLHYERGEAYESLEEYGLARSDYGAAADLLLEPHWKQAARDALASVIHQEYAPEDPHAPEPRTLRAEVHRLHLLHRLPHEVRADAISAVVRFDAEPNLAAVEFRTCLERLVWMLVDKATIRCSDKADLIVRIRLLERHSVVPPEVATQMHQLRMLGNEGAHLQAETDSSKFEPVPRLFADIAKWFCDSEWSEPEGTGGRVRVSTHVGGEHGEAET